MREQGNSTHPSEERKWNMAKHRRQVAPKVATSHESQPTSTGPDAAKIAALAYQLWLERGCPIGSDQDDWFRAESILQSRTEGTKE
jgi:hypothetical protein